MIIRTRFTRLALLACALIAVYSPVSALQVTKTPVPGVTLTQDINTDPASAQILNVLSVDMANPDLTVRAVTGRDNICSSAPDKGREIVSSMVGRKGAVAGVNADFFPFTGDPLGLCIVDGELVSEPSKGRVAMGITKDRKVVFDIPRLDATLTLAKGAPRQIDGINRVRETNQIIVYTDTYGASTLNKYKGTDVVCSTTDLPVQLGKALKLKVVQVRTDAIDVAIPKGGIVISAGGPAAYFLKENLKADDELTIRFDLKSGAAIDWTQVDQAVGGGPWLVKEGAEFVDADAEGFAPAFSTTSHPRTAVGITADNKLLMVTIDGRQSISQGSPLKALAATMKRLGAINAINFDGGGSTTMSVRGAVVNSPCEGVERMVADALIVTSKSVPDELPKLKISGIEGSKIAAGENTRLFLTWGDDGQMLTDEQLARVVWGTTGGIGFVNQGGYFMPMNVRKGSVKAVYGSQVVSLDLEVVSGQCDNLIGRITPDGTDPMRCTITAILTDSLGNPVPGQELALTAVGGALEAEKGITNDRGVFSTAVVWTSESAQHSVTISAGDLKTTVTDPNHSTGAAPSRKLTAVLVPDPNNSTFSDLDVTLLDLAGKPVAGVELTVSVAEGKADAAKGITNEKGQFSTHIAWTKDTPACSVTVTSGDLTSVVVR